MLDVKQTLNDASERMEMATMYLNDELQRIRAGRANVAILDGVRVDSYGSKVPLNQVASVFDGFLIPWLDSDGTCVWHHDRGNLIQRNL